MNRRLMTRLLIVFITSFSILGVPLGAYAHDGPPRLELSTNQVNPGAVIEVRGINLAPEVPIVILLARDEYEVRLGEVMSDADGDFIQTVTLPLDLTEGDYTVRAAGKDQDPVSALLKIEGAALVEAGEQRGDEEPLLAPMPTRAPDSVAVTPATAPRAVPPTAVPGASSAAWLLLPLGALAVVGLALALRRRSMQ